MFRHGLHRKRVCDCVVLLCLCLCLCLCLRSCLCLAGGGRRGEIDQVMEFQVVVGGLVSVVPDLAAGGLFPGFKRLAGREVGFGFGFWLWLRP
ncbi:hypothetical protein D9M69_681390 [compost metagenome]